MLEGIRAISSVFGERVPLFCIFHCCAEKLLLSPPLKVDGGYVVCLFVCLRAGYLKKVWTDSDEAWWIGWVGDKDELTRFW